MTAMELMPTEQDIERDVREFELAAERNKRELLERHSNGIQVIAYFLVAENVTTIWIRDERTNSAVEFQVDPARVMEFFDHPFSHKDANLPRYEQGGNGAH